MKLFQKKGNKSIEQIPTNDGKKQYYKHLLNTLVNTYSNYSCDYKNKQEPFFHIINNVDCDYQKRDMFFVLYHILKEEKYKNLVRVYDYKLFDIDMKKNLDI